jgi:hypothetical protein
MGANISASLHAMTETHAVANENMASLFQPDTLLSGQYFDDRRRSRLLEPEHKLMLAILEDAVECFQANCSARCGKRKRVFDDAREWIFESRKDWIFGFENICNVLGFHPEYIRKGLLRWRQRELAKARTTPLWDKTTAPLGRRVAANSRVRSLVGPRSNIQCCDSSL